MKKIMAIVEKEVHGGSQKIYKFANGYGASVVCHSFSYGGDKGQKEIAVLKFIGDSDKFDLCYETPITDDVIGYLDEDEVQPILNKIAALKVGEGKVS